MEPKSLRKLFIESKWQPVDVINEDGKCGRLTSINGWTARVNGKPVSSCHAIWKLKEGNHHG